MKLGVVVDGPDRFIGELLADWQLRYETQLFAFHPIKTRLSEGRINAWRLRNAVGQFLEKNDAVLFEWAGPLLIIASHLSVKARILVRVHSFDLFDYAPRVRWDAVERIVLVSEAMKRHFCERFPDAAHKTVVVYNGVSLEKFYTSERKFSGVVGMLANLVPIKRVYETILAIYDLNRMGVPLELRIAGSPDRGAEAERYYLSLQRIVRQLGLAEQVRFVGYVSDPAAFLKDIDIFVSNSYWEGQQVALLEAMAAGCYCVSHIWDGVEETLPAQNLFVTEADLQQKIIEYSRKSDAEKKRYQAELRALACAKFNIEQTKSQIRQLIQES